MKKIKYDHSMLWDLTHEIEFQDIESIGELEKITMDKIGTVENVMLIEGNSLIDSEQEGSIFYMITPTDLYDNIKVKKLFKHKRFSVLQML